jgi:GNAT superfamily N-acetyltransferase
VWFAQGKSREVARVLADVPPGVVQYTLQVSTREPVAARLKADREVRMWRMVLDGPRFASTAHPAVFPPSHDDVDEMLDVFDNHPDPLLERRLDDGFFYGVREAAVLVCIARTHVVAPAVGVAAVGSVYARPDRRGQVLGIQADGRGCPRLARTRPAHHRAQCCENNAPALAGYRRPGFREDCSYLDGVGGLALCP